MKAKTIYTYDHGPVVSFDDYDILYHSHNDLLEALEDLRKVFVIAVGDKSPFAKVALSKTDDTINKARGL